jgi:Tfp pilus assembly protein PilX
MTLRRRPRGYVLLFVLMILLVLTLIVASLYSQAQELRSANLSASFQQVAAMNADRGVQVAIQAMRSGALSVVPITTPCTPGEDHRTNCPSGYVEMSPPSADGGVTILTTACTGTSPCSPAEGAGLQFTYFVYRSAVPNTPTNRYTIQATGYAGNSEAAVSLVTAVVEAEIELGKLQFQCTNSYECNGG